MSEQQNQAPRKFSTTWYFKVAAEAGMARNRETGENAPAYLKYSVDHKEPIDSDKYEEMQGTIGAALAEMTGSLPEHFIPITESEYLENVPVDDEEDDFA